MALVMSSVMVFGLVLMSVINISRVLVLFKPSELPVFSMNLMFCCERRKPVCILLSLFTIAVYFCIAWQ